MVNKHGGFIDVKSTPGKGSAFSLYLPAVLPKSPPAADSQARPDKDRGRLLLMDDEETVRQVMRQMVGYLGYRADLAAGGEEVIRRYRKSMKTEDPYQAVILDLTVPREVFVTWAISS